MESIQLKPGQSFIGQCNVFINPSYLYIEPVVSPIDGHIRINRTSCEVTHSESVIDARSSGCWYLGCIDGIIGIKHLVKRSYLLAIGSSSVINQGSINKIMKIERLSVFPIQDVQRAENESFRDSIEWRWEDIYLKMLSDLFKTNNFYFSLSYDLTNSVQRNVDIINKLQRNQPYKFSDPRFQWNINLLSNFESSLAQLSRFRLPIIMGFATEKIIKNEKSSSTWQLISRRSILRAGTRYNKRGADEDGNVANFVETEQILYDEEGITSFVQIRGSIPMYWSQSPTVKYKPAIVIHSADHESAMEKHYRELKNNYVNVSVACLIDQSGHEAELTREFNMKMNKIQPQMKIPYHYFDFHKECSKMRWHRLNILLEDLIPEINGYGFYMRNSSCNNKQTGVIRSNCIDSLDRTNVVQSMIAQFMLDKQLSFIGRASLSDFPDFLQTYKDAWADNADALSIQYAGTPALKTDFTRTGKRSYAGILQDGLNSATRYIANNYLDNYRQDSIDLLLNNFNGYPSPTYKPLDIMSYSSTFPVAIIMFTLVALYFYFRHDSLRWTDS